MRHLSLLAVAALLGACGERLVQNKPQLDPPLNQYDFGAVPVLTEVTLPEVPVRNVGKAKLTVSRVRLTAGEGPFTLRSFPTEVDRSTDDKIVVSFVPPKEADYAATLEFDTDDVENPSVKVELTGKGSTRAVMTVSPEQLDFGRVNECTSAVKTFTIESSGTADLIVEEIAFTDGTSAGFSKVGSWTTPATVKFKGSNGLPGAITLTVKFTAAAGMTSPASGGLRIRGNDPDHREVVIPLSATVNQAPSPHIGMLGNGSPGQVVMLDGTASSDADMDLPLTYKWTLRSAPLSATTRIMPADMATASMTLDPVLPGSYEVQLDVTDASGAKSCAPARQTIVATPAQKLLVEMFWDNADTDLDLHVLRTTASVVGRAPDDCFYANLNPDWGQLGSMDDPTLMRDALTGYGPEVFGYVNPVDSTYRVVAEFANEHLSPMPASNVTVRVYLFGVLKFEQQRSLTTKGQRWAAVDVAWPSGAVTPVP